MTPEVHQWQVNLVKDRHFYLNLTYEQAEKVCLYEQEKDIYSEKHSFTVWEEWDYERATFRQILNEEQLKEYEAFHQQQVQRYEQSLVEQDDKENEITYHTELLHFYLMQILPGFFSDPLILSPGWLPVDKTKIEYLKAEYVNFLNDTKKAILTHHFRHNKTFKPNELKLSLLRHKLLYILPDYHSFKRQADEPTKAVMLYLKNKFCYSLEAAQALLAKKLGELKAFSETNIKKYYGEIKGWHITTGELTPEEEKEHRLMTLLLLDKNKYGLSI